MAQTPEDERIFGDGQWEDEDPTDTVNSMREDDIRKEDPKEKRAYHRPNANIRLTMRDGESLQIMKADDLFVRTEAGISTLSFKNDEDRILFSSKDIFSPGEITALSPEEISQIGQDTAESLGMMIKEEMDPDRTTRRNVIDLRPLSGHDIIESMKNEALEKNLSRNGGWRIQEFRQAVETNESYANDLLSRLGADIVGKDYPAGFLISPTTLDSSGRVFSEAVPVLTLSKADQHTAENIFGKALQKQGFEWHYDKSSAVFYAWVRTESRHRPDLRDFRKLRAPTYADYLKSRGLMDVLRQETERAEKAAQKPPYLNIRLTTRDGEQLSITKPDELSLETRNGITALSFRNDRAATLFSSRNLFLPAESAALTSMEMTAIGRAIGESLKRMIQKEMDPDRTVRRSVIDLSARSDIDYIGSLKKAYIEKCLERGGDARRKAYEYNQIRCDALARNLFGVLGIENVTKHYPATILMTTDRMREDGTRGESLVPVLQLSDVGQRTAAPVLGKVMQRYGLEWSYDNNTGVFSAWTRTPQKNRPILTDYRALQPLNAKEYNQILFTMAKIRSEAELSGRSYPIDHGYEKLSTDQIFTIAKSLRSPEEIRDLTIQDTQRNEVFAKAYLTGMGFSRLTRRHYGMEIAEAKTISDLYHGEEEAGTTVVRLHGVSPAEAQKISMEASLKCMYTAYDAEKSVLSVAAYHGPDRPLFEGNLTEPDYIKLEGEGFADLAAHTIGIEEASRIIEQQRGPNPLAVKSESAFQNLKDAMSEMKKYEVERQYKGIEKSRKMRAALHELRAKAKDRLYTDKILEPATRIRNERLMQLGYNSPESLKRETMERSR